MTALLSTSDVLEGLEISYRQLDHWISRGAIRPAHRAKGSGDSHGWTEGERRRLRVVDDVVDDLVELGLHHIPSRLVRRIWEATATGWPTVEQGRVTIRLGLEDR